LGRVAHGGDPALPELVNHACVGQAGRLCRTAQADAVSLVQRHGQLQQGPGRAGFAAQGHRQHQWQPPGQHHVGLAFARVINQPAGLAGEVFGGEGLQGGLHASGAATASA
jgi:hypothetical protein